MELTESLCVLAFKKYRISEGPTLQAVRNKQRAATVQKAVAQDSMDQTVPVSTSNQPADGESNAQSDPTVGLTVAHYGSQEVHRLALRSLISDFSRRLHRRGSQQ